MDEEFAREANRPETRGDPAHTGTDGLHVRDAKVENFEHLIAVIELPDPDNRHVVAAAMHAGAELIVTMNIKDFPKEFARW